MSTVQTNGVETYYQRRGDGPPIVFVHGAAVDHGQWLPQAEALSDSYTTVVYDVRGHGRTGGSAVERYTLELFAEDLDALITELDLDQPVICGLSLGGCIAQAHAATYPDRISGLVLADTFTSGDWRWPERLQWGMLRAAVPLARFVGYQRIELAMVWLQKQLRGEEAVGDYERIERLRRSGPAMTTGEFTKVIRALCDVPLTSFDFSDLSVPALILYGEHEMGFVKRHAAKLVAEIDDADIVEVPGGAHASNLDEPEFVTEALRRFLSERVSLVE